MKKAFLILFSLLLVSACSLLRAQPKITDFNSCVAAGNPVMETYPRQCRANGQNYVEIIQGNLNNTNQVACDAMAKLCPDGSAVGRTGPNCEFAPCPGDTGSALSASCQKNKGTWLDQYKECEYIAKAWCDQNGGVFNECASACRHDPKAQVCTMQCVSVCQFQAGKVLQGKVSGQILLGPTCPVMKNPPDPACADKPYKTTIQVIAANSASSKAYATVQSNDQGYYEISLPAGQYALQPTGGSMLPRCETKEITVQAGINQTVNLSCDTGIR